MYYIEFMIYDEVDNGMLISHYVDTIAEGVRLYEHYADEGGASPHFFITRRGTFKVVFSDKDYIKEEWDDDNVPEEWVEA